MYKRRPDTLLAKTMMLNIFKQCHGHYIEVKNNTNTNCMLENDLQKRFWCPERCQSESECPNDT